MLGGNIQVKRVTGLAGKLREKKTLRAPVALREGVNLCSASTILSG